MDEYGNIEVGAEILQADSSGVLPKLQEIAAVYVGRKEVNKNTAVGDMTLERTSLDSIPDGYIIVGYNSMTKTTSAYSAATESNKTDANRFATINMEEYSLIGEMDEIVIPVELHSKATVSFSYKATVYEEITCKLIIAPVGKAHAANDEITLD